MEVAQLEAELRRLAEEEAREDEHRATLQQETAKVMASIGGDGRPSQQRARSPDPRSVAASTGKQRSGGLLDSASAAQDGHQLGPLLRKAVAFVQREGRAPSIADLRMNVNLSRPGSATAAGSSLRATSASASMLPELPRVGAGGGAGRRGSRDGATQQHQQQHSRASIIDEMLVAEDGHGHPHPHPHHHAPPSHALMRERWRGVVLEAKRSQMSGRASQLREAFERACAATGAEDLDTFTSAFTEARRENEALYARVAELARESDALRESLVGAY
jgi:hypothetical protein